MLHQTRSGTSIKSQQLDHLEEFIGEKGSWKTASSSEEPSTNTFKLRQGFTTQQII
jgi:hypothetical protein